MKVIKLNGMILENGIATNKRTVLYTVPVGKIAKVKVIANNKTNSFIRNYAEGVGSTTAIYSSSSSSSSSSVGGVQILNCSSSGSSSSSSMVCDDLYISCNSYVDSSSPVLTYVDVLKAGFLLARGISSTNETATSVYIAPLFDTNKVGLICKNEFILHSGEEIDFVYSGSVSSSSGRFVYDFLIYEEEL